MASEYTPTDEQVYDALLAFRMAQRSEKLTHEARLRGVLWTYGEPTPDDSQWEPMRVALLVALRETEAERDRWHGAYDETVALMGESNDSLIGRLRQAEAERDALARRIETVRALHHPWGDTLTGKYICDACDHPLPCPTIRALDDEV